MTKKYAYPIPDIDRILDKLRKTKYLSKTDLKQTCRQYTAFSVPDAERAHLERFNIWLILCLNRIEPGSARMLLLGWAGREATRGRPESRGAVAGQSLSRSYSESPTPPPIFHRSARSGGLQKRPVLIEAGGPSNAPRSPGEPAGSGESRGGKRLRANAYPFSGPYLLKGRTGERRTRALVDGASHSHIISAAATTDGTY